MHVLDNNNDIPEKFSKIDKLRNIIICTPIDKNYISKNPDSTISILNDFDLNFADKKIMGKIVTKDLYPRIRLSVPYGIKLDFESEKNKPFIQNTYEDHEIFYNNEIAIYKKLHFIVDINLDLMRKYHKKLVISKDDSILYMNFIYTFYKNFKTIDNIYHIKNNYIFEKFVEHITDR